MLNDRPLTTVADKHPRLRFREERAVKSLWAPMLQHKYVRTALLLKRIEGESLYLQNEGGNTQCKKLISMKEPIHNRQNSIRE
jgi:hypothetical protein